MWHQIAGCVELGIRFAEWSNLRVLVDLWFLISLKDCYLLLSLATLKVARNSHIWNSHHECTDFFHRPTTTSCDENKETEDQAWRIHNWFDLILCGLAKKGACVMWQHKAKRSVRCCDDIAGSYSSQGLAALWSTMYRETTSWDQRHTKHELISLHQRGMKQVQMIIAFVLKYTALISPILGIDNAHDGIQRALKRSGRRRQFLSGVVIHLRFESGISYNTRYFTYNFRQCLSVRKPKELEYTL